MHDPKVYADPMIFNPRRFLRTNEAGKQELDSDALDPESVVFGFGRRICPGRHIIYESLWITIACILAVFDISKAMETDGTAIHPEAKFTSGFLRYE